ncbi:Maltooligosyl trehalose synthase [compost metagenome]
MVDPSRINAEVGGEEALRRLVEGLRRHGMGLIVDTVANHMRTGETNPWWQDVLEWGLASPYANFFDIRWHSDDPLLDKQVLLPCLGEDYVEELSAGRIALHASDDRSRFEVRYAGQRFPVCPATFGMILAHAESETVRELSPRFAELRGHPQARTLALALCRQLAVELAEPALLEALLEVYRQDWRALHRLLEQQHYRLANWRVAADDINWRRFFDINELVGLRAEHPEVFHASHAYLLRLIGEGLIDGLRIDHVDGLADPRGYCRRLRRSCQPPGGREIVLYVEKILGPDESLPLDWNVDGSTGYDFLNQVSLLQHDPLGELQLRSLWQEVSGRQASFADETRQARKRVLTSLFAADVEALAQLLWRLARCDLASRDLPLGSIRRSLFQLLLAFPVYRTYAGVCGRSAQDRRYFEQAREAAQSGLEKADHATLHWLDRVLGGEPLRAQPVGRLRRLRRQALRRFQQLTPPIAAKSLEDTACYRSAVALGRNDVGCNPQSLSMPASDFHAACRARQEQFPCALLASATHDHKRGEDCRARLAVLSERAVWFAGQVRHWRQLAASLHRDAAGPSGGDELILYQCLLGSWPLDLSPEDLEGMRAYHRRIEEWQRKAIREAKLESDWSAPAQDYEAACGEFLAALLVEDQGAPLRGAIAAAARSLMPAGALNGLAQCLLRCTTPGVPDLYQGCEFWDFSLVDPDNRRIPDFARRAAALEQPADWPVLLGNWQDGRLKQALIARALRLRAQHPELMRHGDYQPLEVQGEHAARVVAFIRSHAGLHALVVTPRWSAALLGEASVPHIGPDVWADTRLVIPAELGERRWQGLADIHVAQNAGLRIADLLHEVPVNLLVSSGH